MMSEETRGTYIARRRAARASLALACAWGVVAGLLVGLAVWGRWGR